MERNVAAAARRCLEFKDPSAQRLGHTDSFEVYDTDDGIVFVRITDTWDDVDVEALRKVFEDEMQQWFKFHDEPCDVQVRCDVVCVLVVAEGRALVRHYVNACGVM